MWNSRPAASFNSITESREIARGHFGTLSPPGAIRNGAPCYASDTR